MIPFGGFLYFGLLLYLAIPVVVLGILEVKPKRFLLGITLLMVVIQYGMSHPERLPGPLYDIGKVLGFAAGQWVVASLFLRIRATGRHRSAFYSAIAAALLPLALAKFLPGDSRHLVVFMGISYTTFRALDVIFVIQDGLVTQFSVGEYVAYLLFFPAISAGPIDRFLRFRTDYRKDRSRAEFLIDLDAATERIFRGLLYSFVLAPLVTFYWMSPVALETGPVAVASYMYAYSIHLFLDFAGYSAFAIGTGYVLGVRMPENFNRPFWARNIAAFWDSWHITLSTWLRDHVYGRFAFTATKGRWFKDPYVAGYLGSALAFGLMGLWHGTATRYLAYGLYHALLIVAYGMLTRRDRGRRIALPPAVSRLLTFHLVCFGFLIFSGRLF